MVKQYRGPVGPSQFIVFLLLHLGFIELVLLKITNAWLYHSLHSLFTINNFLTITGNTPSVPSESPSDKKLKRAFQFYLSLRITKISLGLISLKSSELSAQDTSSVKNPGIQPGMRSVRYPVIRLKTRKPAIWTRISPLEGIFNNRIERTSCKIA